MQRPIWLAAFAAFAAVALGCGVAGALFDRAATLDQGRADASSTARILEQHARAALRAGDAVVQSVASYVAGRDLADPAVQREIDQQVRTAVANNPQISSLWILDAGGRVLVESTATMAKSDRSFRDRPYFRRALDGNGDVAIGPIGNGTVTGKQRFTLSRSIVDPSGAFRGVVAAGILSESFSAAYKGAGLTDGARLTLVSPEVGLLAAWPAAAPPDAPELAAERQLDEYGVRVRVAVPESIVLAGWRERWILAAGVLLVATAAFGGICALGYRASRREEAVRRALADANGELGSANGRLARVNEELERRVRDRTAELEASKDALRLSERRLNAVLDNTTMAIFMMDERQHCSYMNAAAERLTGYRFEETLGRPLHDIIHHTHPDGTPFPLQDCRIDRAFPENNQEQGEEVFVHRDGRFYPVAFTASPIRDEAARAIGTVIEVRDISAERAARAALERSEERLRLATAGAGVGTFEVDLASGVGEWSGEATAQMGLGRSRFTTEDWLDAVHPDDRPAARAAWVEAVEGRGEYQVRFRVGTPAVGGARWLLARGTVERDVSGRPRRAAGMMLDVTRQVEAETALATSLAELQAFYDTAPVGLCMLDTGCRFVRVNRKLAEYNGVPVEDHVGRTVAEVVPGIGEAVRDVLERVISEKRPVIDFEMVGETAARPGVVRHFNESFVPVLGRGGAVIGVNIVVEETTERRRAEMQRETLINELNHRVKNTLATVQSIIHQTLRAAAVAGDIQEALDARLAAMARSHDLLTKANWTTVHLCDVAAAAVEPFRARDQGDRLTFSGPDVLLVPRAALAVGMALHELATNAVKYGALSVSRGKVDITWEAGSGHLTLVWRESGGPVVAPPTRKGFGARLLERVVAHDLDGKVVLDYPPEGLVCTIHASRTALGREGAS
jgi:PAS domain S-box-containing protein